MSRNQEFSLKENFGLHVSSHLGYLKSLRNGVPSGLPGQVEELSAILDTFDGLLEKLEHDDGLSQAGRARQIGVAYDAAQVAVTAWQTAKTAGLDKQMAGLRATLYQAGDKSVPTPTDFAVSNMVARLASFDPLEVEILYSDATDAERRIIEAAANAIGRQPVRRDDQITWEPIISTDRMSAAVAARAERANPDGAAQLRDLERLRNTFDALASAATGLLHEAFPRHLEPTSVAP